MMVQQVGAVIYSTADFNVEVGVCTLQPWKGKVGYFIRNTRTGVVEAEGSVEYLAIQHCNEFQQLLDAVLKAPGEATPEVSEDMAFDEMMQRFTEAKAQKDAEDDSV